MVLAAMANPMPFAEFCRLDVATMVLIPITWPEAFTRGPPELPELMAASVCSMPVSVSPVPIDV
jgi:hypothetical protein